MKVSIFTQRKMTILIAVALSLLLTGGTAEENSFDNIFDNILPAPKTNFKVWVHVTCDDENTKTFIESHIKRELRSLQDVDIVKVGDHIYELHVVSSERVYKATGQKSGEIGLGWVFLKRFDNKPLTAKYPTAVDRFGVQEMTQWLYHPPRMGIFAFDTTDLDEICKRIVVKFDTQMLEPNRK